MSRVLTPPFVFVIPGPEPTGPAFGRPDDRLRAGTWNPVIAEGAYWIAGSPRAAKLTQAA